MNPNLRKGNPQLRYEHEVEESRALWFTLKQEERDLLSDVVHANHEGRPHEVAHIKFRPSAEFRTLVTLPTRSPYSFLLTANELGLRVYYAPYVRVDLFKPSGKYYTHGYVDMRLHTEGVVADCVLGACTLAYTGLNNGEWPLSTSPEDWLKADNTIVCLEPFHKHSFPVMLRRYVRPERKASNYTREEG